MQQLSPPSPTSPPVPPPLPWSLPEWPVLHRLNLPCQNLFQGSREDYLEVGVPLYEASLKCNWKAAKAILDEKPELVRYSITENGETPLHIAASSEGAPKRKEKFVKNLVDIMDEEDLELQNKQRKTALYLAAVAGNLKTVKIMVKKNRKLLTVSGDDEQTMPLYGAVLFGNEDVAEYIYEESTFLCDEGGWNNPNHGCLIEKCMERNMFDMALKIIQRNNDVDMGKLLRILAAKPEAFHETEIHPDAIIKKSDVDNKVLRKNRSTRMGDQALQLQKGIFERLEQMEKETQIKITRETYSNRAMFIAAEMGNTSFLVELIRRYPDLVWNVNERNQSIFHIAVKNRHIGIYSLLYELGALKDLITTLEDPYQNNMLHLAGKSATEKRLKDVPGVAFRMQQELLWFHEVKNMIPLSYRERKNADGLKPHELFTMEHKNLVALSEKWIKETASQTMVVAALVATVTFAAIITIPGGYDQESGIPIFHSEVAFILFVLADAVSLILTAISILSLMSILTSRYAEHDFMELLPRKLILGLATAFLSVAFMMHAFGWSFVLLFDKRFWWIQLFLAMFAFMPAFSLFVHHYGPYSIIFRMTFQLRYMFKPTKLVLYYRIPKM